MFNANALLALLNARPFTPFRLIISDGGTVDVLSREMVFPLRNCAIIAVFKAGETETLADQWTTVWYMHVTRIEMLKSGQPPFQQPPPSGDEAQSSAA